MIKRVEKERSRQVNMMLDDLLQVGVITSTHGLKGEVKVFPTTDDMTRFDDLECVIFDSGKGKQEVAIENVKYFKNMVILKFKGFDRIEDVETLRQTPLYITREQAVPLEENEYFIADLIGCTVILEDQSEFGVVKEVLSSKSNDVYVVKTKEGKEVLIPAIYECILDVDIAKRVILVHLLEGLVE